MAKPWLTFRANGARWRVYLVDSDDPRIIGAEGVTFSRTHEIVIDEALPVDRRMAVLGHELFHVACTHANAELLAGALHCPKDEVTDAEEAMASLVGATLGEIIGQIATQARAR